MDHETSHTSPGFGKNSNGFGLVIVAAVLVIFVLASWGMWNSGSTENEWYRFAPAAHAAEGHEGQASHGETAETANANDLGVLDTKGNFIYAVGDTVGLKLPDGSLMKVGDRSTEAKLLRFLTDGAMAVDTANKSKGWMTCDRIYFESSKSTLTETSQIQVANIAAILKAFPAAEIKVGGYTDNSGDSAANARLSAERAAAVLAAIKAAGAANAVSSEGYGPQWPLVPNDSEAGKARNRRVDIKVVKK